VEINLASICAFLTLSKFRTLEGLKNDNSGQFINLQELTKVDRENLKNALAPMKELEELIKNTHNTPGYLWDYKYLYNHKYFNAKKYLLNSTQYINWTDFSESDAVNSFFVFDSKKSKKAKLIHVSIPEYKLEIHEEFLNKAKRYFDNQIKLGFKPKPEYKRCIECDYLDICLFKVDLPEIIHINL
jgi:hypothetical protein